MKYLSILSVLLLIGGNFSFAMEDGDSTQQSEMTRIDWLKKNAKARAEKTRKKQEEQKNEECNGTFCDENNILEKDMNCNEEKINITKGKTNLKKKIGCKNEFCDNNSDGNNAASSSNEKLPIFHNTGELKGRYLRDGVIMLHNDDMDEDVKDEKKDGDSTTQIKNEIKLKDEVDIKEKPKVKSGEKKQKKVYKGVERHKRVMQSIRNEANILIEKLSEMQKKGQISEELKNMYCDQMSSYAYSADFRFRDSIKEEIDKLYKTYNEE